VDVERLFGTKVRPVSSVNKVFIVIFNFGSKGSIKREKLLLILWPASCPKAYVVE